MSSSSLKDFQNHISRSFLKGVFALWVSFSVVFQLLVFQLQQSERSLSQVQYEKAIQSYFSALAGKVSLVANSQTIHTFLRSGEVSRNELHLEVIKLLAQLRGEEIVGASITLMNDQVDLASIGQNSEDQIIFDLCYLGDNLNPGYGRCLASLVIHLDRDRLKNTIFAGTPVESICKSCKPYHIVGKVDLGLLRFSKRNKFEIQEIPKNPDIFKAEVYFILLSFLVLGFGFYIRGFLRKSVQSHIIEPVNSFLYSLDSGATSKFTASNSFSEIVAIQRHHSTITAVAQTTQALAHDVRKPFTMFKMIIDTVDGEDDPIEAKQLLKESLPEVQQAMASVNGMIADVLEIGSESAPFLEPTNPETLIESTLNEIFRIYPDSKIFITYTFNHKHKVSVDTLKIGRVFSNIIGNAVQAMNSKGKIWFKTEELNEEGKPMTRFCLGNGRSFIPAESLSKIFDAFFTSGKKGGTGLGLAIAQKIVTAHGGRIWCESDEQRGVEFYFTLPQSIEKIDSRPQSFPTSSTEIAATFERLRGQTPSSHRAEVDALEVTIEKEIIKLSLANKAPLRVLIVDDEGVYRNSLAALVNRSEELKAHILLSFAKNSDEALEAGKVKPALVILDVDLGYNSLNGYEVLQTLRSQEYGGVVCIHSNRSSTEDFKTALSGGADTVLPKPMSRAHFLKLALQAAEWVYAQKVTEKVLEASLPEFAVVDDSTLVLRAWKRKSKGEATVHTFESPAAFRAAEKADPCFLARLSVVVTDFYFAAGVTETGLSFGEDLKKSFLKPVILSSNGEFNSSDTAGCFDAVIAKDPLSWTDLKGIIKA